jgi:ribosomal protein S27AE
MINKNLCCSICGTSKSLAIVKKDVVVYCGKCYLTSVIYPEIKSNNDINYMTEGFKEWNYRKN